MNSSCISWLIKDSDISLKSVKLIISGDVNLVFHG